MDSPMIAAVGTNPVIVGALVAAAIAASVGVQALVRRKASRVVSGRSPLGAAERPDDKLCEDLQLAVIDGLDANAFVEEVGKLAGLKIPGEAAAKMRTLRDIIRYVAAR